MQVQERQVSAADFEALRRTAIDCQVRPFGVTDQRLLASFLETPREKFVPAGQEDLAYSDRELSHPLAGGPGARTMIPPIVLARLLQAAEIKPSDSVLDVGGAAGYTAALAARLTGRVVALESDEALARRAGENFAALGLANATALCAPLAEGAAGKGPFDVVVVNGAADVGLEKLLDQLASGGRLVTLKPEAAGAARAFVYRKDGSAISCRSLFEGAGKLLPEFAAKPAFVF